MSEAQTGEQKGTVVAVCRKAEPGLPKHVVTSIHLLEGLGIEGDYHAGLQVRHRYLARKDPTRPNVRQVLLVDATVYPELAAQDIHVSHGMLGENIVVDGLAVMKLPAGTRLHLGSAIIEITEIRKPCTQLEEMDTRLLKAVSKRAGNKRMYQAGIMARVLQEGWVRPGDSAHIIPQA